MPIDDVSQAIGQLQAAVEGLRDLTERNTVAAERNAFETAKQNTALAAISKDVAVIKPIAERFKKWEQRVIGVGGVAAFIGGIFGPEVLARVKGIFT